MRELKWYIAYTNSRFEKKVNKQIQQLGIKSFLPLCKTKRKWSDRVKIVELPLFPNYIFIKTNIENIPILEELNGVSKFLTFDGKLATIQEYEIRMIDKILANNNYFTKIEVIPHRNINKQKVKITQGIFAGLEGILLREEGDKDCLVISIDSLNQNLLITIPSSHF